MQQGLNEGYMHKPSLPQKTQIITNREIKDFCVNLLNLWLQTIARAQVQLNKVFE
jgi:hypothetical protein